MKQEIIQTRVQNLSSCGFYEENLFKSEGK